MPNSVYSYILVRYDCKYMSTKLDNSKFNNNSIKHQTFVYIQLNDQTVLFQTIQFGIGQILMVPSIVMYH